jgi:hypothetical protein
LEGPGHLDVQCQHGRTLDGTLQRKVLMSKTDLGDLGSAQHLVGDILRPSGLECSRHG